jgi:hypothetical protein
MTMKYLCLVYFEPGCLSSLSPDERKAFDRASGDYDKDLERRGNYILAALQPVNTATTVRVRDGKVSMTDGPFAETREVLGGFIFIEAKDLDEALEIAAGIPLAKHGSIEVRPEMSFD